MPELPEVETQRRQLLKNIKGLFFEKIETEKEKMFFPSFESFRKKIIGKEIKDIQRRGKFLVFDFSENMTMVAHFRMTGHFLIAKKKNDFGEEKCIRAIFYLNNGWRLLYQDIRIFGRFWAGGKKEVLEKSGINKLGVEPLEKDFTFEKFLELAEKRRGYLKHLLLNQNFLAGIGNIYADEALFRARLHPLSRMEKLKLGQKKDLYEAIRYVLAEGVKRRGTTVGEYVDASGKKGSNQKILKAYGRKDLACFECGGVMKRSVVVQRGTVFCEECQKLIK